MADGKAIADPKAPVINLVGPEAMSHNVYNHILLSPTQVSRNLSLPPNQSSVLIGGRSRAGDRVIENLNSSAGNLTSPKPKEDGFQFSTSSSTSCIFEDFMANEETSRAEETHSVCTITSCESACLSPSKEDDGICTDDKKESELSPDECERASQDDKGSIQEDNQVHTVEDFIKLHLKYSSEKSQSNISNEASTSQDSGDEPTCSVKVLQQLAQKTNDIIRHNRQLQQQISALKKETTLQTKVLTKLLRKKQKRLQTYTKTKL